MPPTGDLACNPGMCPDGNQTSDPLVHRPTLNPLSYTSQGLTRKFKDEYYTGEDEGVLIKLPLLSLLSDPFSKKPFSDGDSEPLEEKGVPISL